MILEADKLSFSFEGGEKVFQDVSFSLEKGEILTILGPNGAGKSTLLTAWQICIVQIPAVFY